MLVSENGKLIELPEDVRPTDKYKIYENTLVVNYVERKMYSFYVQQATGLKKEAEGLKVEPRFFESGFILIELPGENVLYNTNENDKIKVTKKGKIKTTKVGYFFDCKKIV